MVNLTDCKDHKEALDKFAREVGYMDIPAKIIVHKSEIAGIDFIMGEAVLRWRKPKEKE